MPNKTDVSEKIKSYELSENIRNTDKNYILIPTEVSGKLIFRVIWKPVPRRIRIALCSNHNCKVVLFQIRKRHPSTGKMVCDACYYCYRKFRRDRVPGRGRKKPEAPNSCNV
ncbi:unnamed protein product [Caenorhabditis brenneri]